MEVRHISLNGIEYDLVAKTNFTTCTLPIFTAAGSKEVECIGVTTSSHPTLDVYIDAAANVDAMRDAWSHIYKVISGTNKLTFYSDKETSTAITVLVKDY